MKNAFCLGDSYPNLEYLDISYTISIKNIPNNISKLKYLIRDHSSIINFDKNKYPLLVR